MQVYLGLLLVSSTKKTSDFQNFSHFVIQTLLLLRKNYAMTFVRLVILQFDFLLLLNDMVYG